MNVKNTNRTNMTQLASASEVESMIQIESNREPLKSKLNKHYPNFEPAIKWLEILGLDTKIFKGAITHEEAFKLGAELKDKIINGTLDLLNSGDDEIKGVIKSITSYLAEEDSPVESNIIVIFGSSDVSRVEKGVELWTKNVAPLILITGGQPFYKEEKVPEAILFARHAIKLGVPKDKIIVEPNSINIPDNVKTTLNLLDNLGIDYTSKGITAVSAWFTNQRIWSHFMKLSPEDGKFYKTSPYIDSGRLMKEHWFDNEIGIPVIFNEFVKMRTAILVNNIA